MKTSSPPRILIDVRRQRLLVLSDKGEQLWSYPVSTSQYGLGFEEGSLRTPTGQFQIADKIGSGEPPWMSFKGRVSTGVIANPGGEQDLILSRILWLNGIDPENGNTRDRYIYIHGTNQEDKIGERASHGCIRLRNLDMIELFERVSVGDLVEIRG
ncbi:MAG: L,D-transpeptidase [bacterium]